MIGTTQCPRSSGRAPITPFGVFIGLGIVLVVSAVGWRIWTTVVGVREEVNGIVESRRKQAACELRLLDARWVYTQALFDDIVRRVKVDPEADDGGLPKFEQFGIVGAASSDADGGGWTVVVDNIAVFRMSRVPRNQEPAADARNAARWILYSWRCDDPKGMSSEYDRRSPVVFALLSDGQVRWAIAPQYCGTANAPSVTAAMTALSRSELATDDVGADGETWRTGSPDQFLSADLTSLDGGDASSIKLDDGR